MARHLVLLVCLALLGTGGAAAQAEAGLVAIVNGALAREFANDWSGLEKLPGIRWAAQPPTMLQNCLPDGGCFTWQGTATIAGRNLAVVATGARSIVAHLYFRNGGTPFGEAAVLTALTAAGAAPRLARCPVRGSAGGTKWYRLGSSAMNPGVLAIQSSCGGRPCEGFVLTLGETLPPLQPNQVSLYSEQCAEGAERKPVAPGRPHELLAEAVVALLVPASDPALYGWETLATLPAGITWASPRPGAPLTRSGSAEYATRRFSANAIGTVSQVQVIQLEEHGLHPRGEHLLGVVYAKGIEIRLVRCGPIYTESTNNWYSLRSPRTRPAMIRQSIRYDGNQVQDSYELRLDGSLPARDSRDRDPGVNGCR